MELEHIPCPLCESKSCQPLFAHGGEQHVRCLYCGLIYVNPRQARTQVEAFYEEKYYHLEQKKVEFASRLELFAEAAQRIEGLASRGCLLDIGCGYGDFLLTCRQRGWQVTGVELGGAACAKAREAGLDVFHGTLTQARYPEGSFEVVTLWNVLDLVVDPLAEMREVWRVLKPGGVVFFRVSNTSFHLRAKAVIRLLNRWKLHVRDVTTFHTTSFSPQTVRFLLEKTEFVDIWVDNSPMSAINPWSVKQDHRAWLIGALKALIRLGVRAGALVSAGRWLWAPAIEVQARKGEAP
ncbi:MAG: class I SAM-dependent methyltransferase [Chloroflexi bacterium]|nr:class I SAM-dependent methyltransferase [Chloroflexota bacterium]